MPTFREVGISGALRLRRLASRTTISRERGPHPVAAANTSMCSGCAGGGAGEGRGGGGDPVGEGRGRAGGGADADEGRVSEDGAGSQAAAGRTLIVVWWRGWGGCSEGRLRGARRQAPLAKLKDENKELKAYIEAEHVGGWGMRAGRCRQ